MSEQDELIAMRERVAREHLCDCETCQRSGPICPASASSLIEETAVRRLEDAKSHATIDSLRAELAAVTKAGMHLNEQWLNERRASIRLLDEVALLREVETHARNVFIDEMPDDASPEERLLHTTLQALDALRGGGGM